MRSRRATRLLATALAPLLALAAAAPSVAAASAPPAGGGTGPLTTVAGNVQDLWLDSNGDLLFCTIQGDVGTISTQGVVTILADAASGPFPIGLRGVCELSNGDVAVVDATGNVFVLPGRTTPAEERYTDLFMIQDASDLLVDADDTFVITSATPSNGKRGINWVSSDGDHWAYYLVEHAPLALAADPLGPGLFLADADGGGVLRLIDASDETHPAALLDGTTGFGFTAAAKDGDVACEEDGDALVLAGGTVWRYDRGLGQTALLAGGLFASRGLAIAASSGNVASATGWSAYVAEGSSPTTITEIGGVDAPASPVAAPLGTVPGRGRQVMFYGNLRVYELATDAQGELLVGGDLFGASPSVRRVDLSTNSLVPIADDTDGISGRIEGIAASQDGTIYAMTSLGVIHAITENPTQVSTVFSDPFNDVVSGWDMVLGVDGTLYVADREMTDVGKVVAVSNGVASTVVATEETRGLAADPVTGDLYVSEWNALGFDGSVGRLDLGTQQITPVFQGVNYSNAEWGDGDIVVDVEGNVYTCSEDDWRVVKYDPTKGRFATIGSGYINHPSGLAIARSRPSSGSTTGWSLYLAEFDFLWEIPSVPPPAVTIVGCSAPASHVVRNGSGANPLYLAESAPGLVGLGWGATVDVASAGAVASVVVTSFGGPLAGLPLPYGELLVLPPFLLETAFGEHFIALPNQCSLVGATISFQAATIEVGPLRVRLTNAVDVTFGTF